MQRSYKTVLAIIVMLLLAAVAFFFLNGKDEEPMSEPIEEPVVVEPEFETIGRSVQDRPIEVITFGIGSEHLLFVGGIHGGYEWNSVLLAYEVVDYLQENPDAIPEPLSVSIIPNLNPDGVFAVVGKDGRFTRDDVVEPEELGVGRFNANNVDLNRNFDCKWEPESTWRGEVVSAGEFAFSEPEAAALRDYVLESAPETVVFWHSQADAVYASECEDGILPETLAVLGAYTDVTDYRAVESFDAYPITGDAEGWLASIGIPAITVELQSHEDIEFERNLEGVEALISYFERQYNIAR